MANEGNVRAVLSMKNGLVARSLDSGNIKFDQAEVIAHGPVTLSLTDSYASISKGSVASPHWLYIQNNTSDKAVIISVDGTNPSPILIPANGYPCLIPLDPACTITNIKAKVATGTGSIDYAVLP